MNHAWWAVDIGHVVVCIPVLLIGMVVGWASKAPVAREIDEHRSHLHVLDEQTANIEVVVFGRPDNQKLDKYENSPAGRRRQMSDIAGRLAAIQLYLKDRKICSSE